VTTYVSTEVVRAAQAAIAAHSIGTSAGKCAACDEREPCRIRNAAHATLAQFGVLPHRTPGRAGAHWRRGSVGLTPNPYSRRDPSNVREESNRCRP
jgi:hypothetical protein